jgi:hypothetical protein
VVDALGRQFGKRIPREVLIAATEQQHDRIVECLDSCQGALGSCGDRIVVPSRAAQLTNEFESMGNAFECGRRLQHRVDREARRLPNREGRQHVTNVVIAAKLQTLPWEQWRIRSQLANSACHRPGRRRQTASVDAC